MTEKPVIFISHASTDKPVANILKQEIEVVFGDAVEVFVSSLSGSIEPGSDWLKAIQKKLDDATIVVVLITPISINRPWIWFEIGASWLKMVEKKRKIYPLCAPEIELGSLPEPLSRLQALSLGKTDDIKEFFKALRDVFGFGEMKDLKPARIKSNLPKSWSQLKIDEKDLDAGTIYTGPYRGYSDDELQEIISQGFFVPNMKQDELFANLVKQEITIPNGKLLHFKQIDEQLKLPPGTAKKFLIGVAARFRLIPAKKWENSVMFTDQVSKKIKK
ncbi:MAG: toll/interleukin-1 receptor domain-containing protein [Acetobacterium sp.]|nr:toll/interleukin-1 receptor domain-containing protein [Acetobacterium sp.]